MFIYKSFLPRFPNNRFRNPGLSSSLRMELDSFPLVGLDLGYPLNLITNLFTTLHYDYDLSLIHI